MDCDPGNSTLSDQIKVLRKKSMFLQGAEKEFFSQQAKIKHLLNSDKDTSYFHSLVKRNSTKNYISFLCRSDGTEISN